MPLPLPTLDRLEFEELVAEGRAALPVLAPGTTDVNAHDPGITLLELFAYLAESDSYRLDLVSEAARRAFLRLAGVEQRSAQVAETPLVFRKLAGAATLVTAATQVATASASIRFQTLRYLYVSTARLQAIVCGDSAGYTDLGDATVLNAQGFHPLGQTPQPRDAFYIGFDKALAPTSREISLWLAGVDVAADHEMRMQLQADSDARQKQAARLCPANAIGDWRQHYGARTVWEYYVGNDQWQALPEVEDETRGLTLSGVVRFKAPEPGAHVMGGVALPAHALKRFIRCKLQSGGYDCPPRLAGVFLNAVLARHALDVPARQFRSFGLAGQAFPLSDQPVAPGSTKISLALKNGNQDAAWREAPNWDGVGPHDRVYVLDSGCREIRFGNGRTGRVPPAHAQIAVSFQLGGGVAGNLAAGSLTHLIPARSNLAVQQPCAAYGGAAAESLDEASARAVAELAAPSRASTLSDCETLALAIPGLEVIRAHAIADYHPDFPCIPISGSTTIVILPPCPGNKPMPSAGLLAAAQQFFEQHRLLAGEIHIAAPSYTTVTVRAVLHAEAGANARELVRNAEQALSEFFHPLRGGTAGIGWPVGRDVYRAEVLALLNGIEGVSYVDQLALQANDSGSYLCGNVTICRHGLVASGAHEILVDEGSTCDAGKTTGTAELLQRHGCGCSRLQN